MQASASITGVMLRPRGATDLGHSSNRLHSRQSARGRRDDGGMEGETDAGSNQGASGPVPPGKFTLLLTEIQPHPHLAHVHPHVAGFGSDVSEIDRDLGLGLG